MVALCYNLPPVPRWSDAPMQRMKEAAKIIATTIFISFSFLCSTIVRVRKRIIFNSCFIFCGFFLSCIKMIKINANFFAGFFCLHQNLNKSDCSVQKGNEYTVSWGQVQTQINKTFRYPFVKIKRIKQTYCLAMTILFPTVHNTDLHWIDCYKEPFYTLSLKT